MNLKILIVEPAQIFGEMIAANYGREFGADVTYVTTGDEAIDIIKKGEFFNLLVVRNEAVDDVLAGTIYEPIATKVINLLYDMNLKIPLIVIGKFEHTLKQYVLVSEHMRIAELNRLSLKALELEQKDFEHLKLPEHIGYPINFFSMMNVTPCDVFIRLVKRKGDEYTKRLGQGKTFTREDLKSYEEHGVSELYILKEDREIFMDAFLNQTLKSMKAIPTDETKAVSVLHDSFGITSELIKTMGITPVCIAMVDQTINNMQELIVSSDKLGRLLKKILDNQLGYSYKRSYLISLFSYKLLPKMEWGSGDQLSILFEKISMISFFHDIYLEEEQHLKIMTLEDMKTAKLTAVERDLVMNHANRAALLIQGYPRLPQGIDLTIKQHHGVSNGVGFPEVLTAGIYPMAIFFVVVEDFVTRVLEMKAPEDIKEAIKAIRERYQLPSYRKVAMEIEHMLFPIRS